jgi:hypothetical protein
MQVASWAAGVPLSVLVALGGAIVLTLVVQAAGRKHLASLAIMTAFKAGRALVDQGLAGITDGELARIAQSTYEALPTVVLVGGVPLPVGLLKTYVSETAWVGLVEKEYRAFSAFYRKAMADVLPELSPLGRPTARPSAVAATVAQVSSAAQARQQAAAVKGGAASV